MSLFDHLKVSDIPNSPTSFLLVVAKRDPETQLHVALEKVYSRKQYKDLAELLSIFNSYELTKEEWNPRVLRSYPDKRYWITKKIHKLIGYVPVYSVSSFDPPTALKCEVVRQLNRIALHTRRGRGNLILVPDETLISMISDLPMALEFKVVEGLQENQLFVCYVNNRDGLPVEVSDGPMIYSENSDKTVIARLNPNFKFYGTLVTIDQDILNLVKASYSEQGDN